MAWHQSAGKCSVSHISIAAASLRDSVEDPLAFLSCARS
jgi:hypothetical protein